MKRSLLVILLFLAGCQSGPQPTLYKAGSLPAERQAAYDACKIRSFRDIPQTMVTEVQPGYSDPGTLQCESSGDVTTCRTVGGFDMPATYDTRDANEALRQRHIARCLVQQGYQILDLPLCRRPEDRLRMATMPQPATASAMTCRPERRLSE